MPALHKLLSSVSWSSYWLTIVIAVAGVGSAFASMPYVDKGTALQSCASIENSNGVIEEGVQLVVTFPDGQRLPVTTAFDSEVSMSSDDGQLTVAFITRQSPEDVYIELLESSDSMRPIERQSLLDRQKPHEDASRLIYLGGFEFELVGISVGKESSTANPGGDSSSSATQTSAQCCIRCDPGVWVCCNNCCACGSCCITP